ncbi:MAG: hypothetical protein ACREEL_08385 [Stellaceae bacterium]
MTSTRSDDIARADAKRRRSGVYDNARSKERREAEERGPAAPGVAGRHYGERTELAARHRGESVEMTRRHELERDRYGAGGSGGYQPADLAPRHKSERRKLEERHGRERGAMATRQREERVKEAAEASRR